MEVSICTVSKKYRVYQSTVVNVAGNAVKLPGDLIYLLKITTEPY